MAAEKTATLVKEYLLSSGYKIGIYTVTTVATGDWVDLSATYELIRYVSGYTTADGTDQNGYCAGTDAKAYFVAGTPAASTFMVIGTSTDSVGGST